MLLKRQQEKVSPFLQVTLQNEPPEREKFEKWPPSRRLSFRILRETDNLTDLQTVLNSEDAAFCAHVENRYF